MKTNLVIIFFCIATIVSSSILFVCRLDSYKNELRFRLDPLEENSSKLSNKPGGNGLWIIGDSRAASWETSHLGFISIDSYNLGIDGQTSKQVLERFRNDLDKSRPYCVLIQVGINDLKGIGLLADKSITRSCTDNILQILETCKQQGINAIYSSIFPTGDIELFRRPLWKTTTIDSLIKVNNEIRHYCRESGFIYFDAFKLLESQISPGKAETEYQQNFLHINERGYEYISSHLHEFLSSIDKDWVDKMIE